jgi:hypothetical protein
MISAALFWTLALIIFAFILRYFGIDLIEVLQKVAGN